MSTQINVTDALRGAEAGLEVAIQRILKRDPGHAVHVTSEAKALVVVRQALSQCNGCAVQQGYVPMGQIVHPDDLAVDALAKAMKAKLAKKRAQGYGGWDTDCTQQRLSDLLRKHVDKGDPVDVANFCAFLHARDESITAAPQAEMRITRIDDGPILSVERLDPATNKFVVVAEAGKKSGAPAAVQQGVPKGWQIVPKRLNQNMADAAKCTDARLSVWKYDDVYKAMLANAPTPPTTHPTQQGLEAIVESIREVFAETCDAAVAGAKETGQNAKQKGERDVQLVAGGAATQAERLAIYFRGSEFTPVLHAAIAAQAKQGGE